MARLRTSRLASLGALLFACLMGSAFAQERFTRQVSFDIAAQSVESALLEFSKQADVQVMVGTTSLNGQKTGGVKGTLSVKEALGQLLKNTGLEYQTEGNGTVTIRSSTAAKTEARVRPLVDGRMSASRDAAGEAASNSQSSDEEDLGPSVETLHEVIVTGTNIRGQAPLASNLIVIDQQAIERTAHNTVQDVVHALPQNFMGGGANDGTLTGGGANVDSSAASSINLRGLGPGATLVLLNGRRLAPAGFDGSFVDVASLPASAIDRVEVLLDGASAIYGADAVGGVVNIILKRDYQGAQTRLQGGAPTHGGSREFSAGQLLGGNWSSGSAVVTYDYYERDRLRMRDRAPTSSQDLSPLGGSDFRTRQGNPGTIVSGTRSWAIPAGQDGTALAPSSFTLGTRNLYNANATKDVLPERERHSVFGSLRQQLGNRVELRADLFASERDSVVTSGGETSRVSVPNTNPFYVNPTGGTGNVSIDYNFVRDLGPIVTEVGVNTHLAGIEAQVQLPGNWKASIRADHAKEDIDQVGLNRTIPAERSAALADPNPATAFNPFGDGSFTNPATLERIRGFTKFESESEIATGNLSVTGPVASLPSGVLSAAAGVEYRDQGFSSANRLAGASTSTVRDTDRSVEAAFVEFRAPLVSESVGRPGLARLELSIAGRYDRYSDFGSAVSPAFGLSWSPVGSLTLRVSRTESFKAPTLPSLSENGNVSSFVDVPDPLSSTGASRIMFWSGAGNRDLDAETSEAWSIGIDWSPVSWRGFRTSLTYFDIDFTDRIVDVNPFAFTFLQDPRFADSVIRNPTQEQRTDVCTRAPLFAGSFDDCVNSPIAAILDIRPRNAAQTRQQGLDFLASYAFGVGRGTLDIAINAAYLLKYEEAITAADVPIRLVNTPFHPVDLNLRSSIYYAYGSWGAGATFQYVDNYSDPLNSREIGSWMGVDLSLRYTANKSPRNWLAGTSLSLQVENVLDREPPFFNNSAGIAYDPTTSPLAAILGRMISLQVRKDWSPR